MRGNLTIAEMACKLREIYESEKHSRAKRDMAFSANHALRWVFEMENLDHPWNPLTVIDDVDGLRKKYPETNKELLEACDEIVLVEQLCENVEEFPMRNFGMAMRKIRSAIKKAKGEL